MLTAGPTTDGGVFCDRHILGKHTAESQKAMGDDLISAHAMSVCIRQIVSPTPTNLIKSNDLCSSVLLMAVTSRFFQ